MRTLQLRFDLKAIDPDDDKLRFSIEAESSHGKIAELSSEDATLVFLPTKIMMVRMVSSSK